MSKTKTILCIDDNEIIIGLLTRMFEGKGFKVVSSSATGIALDNIKEMDFAAITLNNRLPNYEGVKLCRKIREFDSLTPIIFFTGSISEHDREAALAAGAHVYLIKPSDIHRITDVVTQLIELREKNLSEDD